MHRTAVRFIGSKVNPLNILNGWAPDIRYMIKIIAKEVTRVFFRIENISKVVLESIGCTSICEYIWELTSIHIFRIAIINLFFALFGLLSHSIICCTFQEFLDELSLRLEK